MSDEQFPLSHEEQVEIRRDAAMGAIEDELSPKNPLEGDVSAETDAKIDKELAKIRQELGVSEEEAEVILAERWIQQRKLFGGN